MSPLRGLIASHARTLRAIIITAALLACGDSSNPVAPGGGGGGGVASITITPGAPTVTIGGQLALQAQVKDGSGQPISGASVFWSSADTSTVTVSSAGVITGKAIGTAQVAASSGGISARVIVTVVTVPVASIVVAPGAATLVVGGTTLLQAVPSGADGQPLTGRTVVWASSAPQVAAVDATGNVIAVSAGSATITATCEGKTASSTITVTVIPIASIAIAPGSASLVVGQSTSLTAIATDAHGNVLGGRPMTWSSADTTIASVSNLGLVTAVGAGTVSITATAEGKSGTAQVVVTPATPTPVGSVAVTPTSASLVIGGTVTLSATVRDVNGVILSGRTLTWASSAPDIATVSSSGVVTAVATGSATITATSEGKSGSSAVTVSAVPVASVAVTPATASIYVGATTTLSAVTKDASGNALSGRVVTWSTSAPSVATVSASGVVTGTGAGDATITAASEGKTATASITVSLAPVATVTVTPTSASLVVGSATTLTAVLKDANGNVLTGRAIAWASNTPGVATVDANGVVTAISAGTATITATSEGKNASSSITVSLIPVASVTLNPTSTSLYVGGTTTISAIAKDANGNILNGRVVTWVSSNPSVATVDAATGLITAVTPGTATLTATSEGKSANASVIVALVPVSTVSIDQSALNMVTDSSVTLTATLRDADGHVLTGRAITWRIDVNRVATIGLTTGILTTTDSTGTAKVIATSETKSDTVQLTVGPAPVGSVALNPLSVGLQVPSTTTITATVRDSHGKIVTGRTITWTSSNTTAASVASSGANTALVTALAQGATTITATSEGKSGTTSVNVTDPVATVIVTPTGPSVAVYATVQLADTTKDAGGTVVTGRAVSWASSVPTTASVDANGLVTGLAAGTSTITATSEGIVGSVTLTVTAAPVATVVVATATPSVQVGTAAQFTDTTKDSHGVILVGRSVTWSSDNTSVATVDAATGLATTLQPGTANIKATSSDGPSGSAVLTVIPVPVAYVAVSPPTFALTVNQQYSSLVATPQDANHNPLAGRAITWSSDNTGVATVDATTGVVTAHAAGSANIIATSEGKTGSAALTVTDPVVNVTVTPATPSWTVGQTNTLTATPTDINGATLTGLSASWLSDNTAVATVDPNTGAVTAVSAGTANISATIQGVTGATLVTIVNVPVAFVDVSPASPSLSLSGTTTVALTATPQDANHNALSGRTVTWSSDNTAVATVDPGTGVVTAVGVGTANITATCETVTGTSSVSVTP